MAQAVEKGALKVSGAEVRLRRVPETLSPDILEKMHALEAQKQFSHIQTVTPDDLEWCDGSIWASPTRFGNVAAQMKAFMDHCGKLWQDNRLVGKAASAICSAGTQHGGLETTITCGFWPFFAHLGMVIVGLPYSFGQMGHDEVFGGSPYGASTTAGSSGERLPSARDLAGAEFQGEHVAKIAKLLSHKGGSFLTKSTESSEKEKKIPKKKTDEKRFSEKRHEKHDDKKHDEKKHDDKKHGEEKKPKSPRKKDTGDTKEKSPTKKKDKEKN